eukprot:CAMPEP_0167775004 /NCGR_PEP_ID=MMETSP0111_2-20121227/2311_1 /TAXON_ID=91324 /ORGANISM="Lotharella globosa, Strain CCCM811" /LENGTH=182 /DNA_ID=CAMNT_0007664857 /DNA_START=1151 /DNA_END=1699 /DNA_ORIENTATION=-
MEQACAVPPAVDQDANPTESNHGWKHVEVLIFHEEVERIVLSEKMDDILVLGVDVLFHLVVHGEAMINVTFCCLDFIRHGVVVCVLRLGLRRRRVAIRECVVDIVLPSPPFRVRAEKDGPEEPPEIIIQISVVCEVGVHCVVHESARLLPEGTQEDPSACEPPHLDAQDRDGEKEEQSDSVE